MVQVFEIGNTKTCLSYIINAMVVNDPGPVLQTWIHLILAWISNYNQYKMWDEITHPFSTSRVQQLNFGNGSVISYYSLLAMWLHIHAGIKLS